MGGGLKELTFHNPIPMGQGFFNPFYQEGHWLGAFAHATGVRAKSMQQAAEEMKLMGYKMEVHHMGIKGQDWIFKVFEDEQTKNNRN